MAKVGIIMDSISCLPADIVKEFDIRIVPIALSINGKAYRDGFDLTPTEFWKLFPTVKEFTTGAPALGEIAKAYLELGQTCPDIVCITVSKVLSAIHEAFVEAVATAKAQNPNLNIEVIDSKNAAGAEGFMVIEAAKAARAGKSLAEVAQVARDMIPRVKLVCAMDTLKYLIRSGRAPKTAYLGELFQVKPLIGLTNQSGLVENLGQVRGKDKAMARLVELVKQYTDVTKPLHLNAHYTNDIADGQKLKEMATAQYKCEDAYVTDYSPVMSGHVGPLFSISFYS